MVPLIARGRALRPSAETSVRATPDELVAVAVRRDQ